MSPLKLTPPVLGRGRDRGESDDGRRSTTRVIATVLLGRRLLDDNIFTTTSRQHLSDALHCGMMLANQGQPKSCRLPARRILANAADAVSATAGLFVAHRSKGLAPIPRNTSSRRDVPKVEVAKGAGQGVRRQRYGRPPPLLLWRLGHGRQFYLWRRF